jgi:hypothetical protein
MNTSAPPEPAATIHAEQLAGLCNLSKRRLYQLAEQNKIPAADNGKFPMLETIKSLFHYYQSDNESLLAVKIQKLQAEAELAEIQLARARGKLLPAEDVRRHFEAVLIALRSGILASNLESDEKSELLLNLKRLGENVTARDDAPEPAAGK